MISWKKDSQEGVVRFLGRAHNCGNSKLCYFFPSNLYNYNERIIFQNGDSKDEMFVEKKFQNFKREAIQ